MKEMMSAQIEKFRTNYSHNFILFVWFGQNLYKTTIANALFLKNKK